MLSGVGGQYNFVAMAHALQDGRSILLIRSTFDEHGTLHSNIRRSYLTCEEQGLRRALQYLKRVVARKRLPPPSLRQLRHAASPPASARPYLQRMELDTPRTLKERALQRVLVYALASTEVI